MKKKSERESNNTKKQRNDAMFVIFLFYMFYLDIAERMPDHLNKIILIVLDGYLINS